jgi:3',5'-cyclic AMP phosphodiesterase CpdA
MGWRFDVNHANLVNYLTVEDHSPIAEKYLQPAPRASVAQLENFIQGLSYLGPDLISSDLNWLKSVQEVAHNVMQRLRPLEDLSPSFQRSVGREPPPPPRVRPETILEASVVSRLLQPLRQFFTGYTIYALIIPERPTDASSPESKFFEEAALSSQREGLILMPDAPPGLLHIMDPFPALQALTKMPVGAPAVAFWTGFGAACALSLDDAKTFFRNEILDRLKAGPHAVDKIIRDRAAETPIQNLLHISDLHFGDPTSDDSRRYLKSQLELIMDGISRVVVTGDLFNTPDAKLRDQFLDFRSDVERMTHKPLIVIPGNHDVRPKGNQIPGLLRQTYEFVVDVGWQPLIIDDDMECVFFCFNSVEEGNLARGTVTDSQRMRIASAFNEERARRKRQEKPEIDAFTKIALVHHHPFAYETIATAGYDAFLRTITGSEDTFTRFEQAEQFVSWCAERKVSLILHGHKHVPHHVKADVNVSGHYHTLVAVGCGSTTGAENSPLCYDVVSLNPTTGRWGVTFYYDASKSGAGFRQQEIIADTRSTTSSW